MSNAPSYTVSVRGLCEFAAKTGDLDLRFTPAPTAQQGREGHQWVAQHRGPRHEAEVSLSGRYQELQVRGRADGYDPDNHALEEVKTFRGALESVAHNRRALHWAQLKVYGWLMCQARGLTALTLTLVYFDVQAQTEHPLSEVWQAIDLQTHFESLCAPFLLWARQELRHRQERDAVLEKLEFAALPFRAGQRDLAQGVFRACVQSRTLLVQAPTGIGKTLGTLYPALRAMPQRAVDKIFYLTAKTPGRQVALEALQKLSGVASQTPQFLRVVELVAKDKSCEHPDKSCHPQSCPLALGFYDRLPAARQAAAQAQWLDQAALRDLARAHAVCPYHLGQEMVRWADVVVGDYNYYFDRWALLHTLTVEDAWRVSVLVDEAHNLYARACSMYSEDLTQQATLEARVHAPAALRGRVDELLNQWQLLQQASQGQTARETWRALEELPQGWLRSLQRLNSSLGETLNDHPSDTPSELLQFYFRSSGFAALAQEFGDHSLCELDQDDALAEGVRPQNPVTPGPVQLSMALAPGGDDPGACRLGLRNLVPAPFLRSRLQTADSMVLFSATLNPPDYYVNLLGLPESTVWLDIPSPFRSEQLRVSVLPISTRKPHRGSTLDTLVQTMSARFRQQPGNYLAFFSSFDYLEMAWLRMQQLFPEVPVWGQQRQMSEPARQQFLQRFEAAGQGIGFAVLGGVFGEGVDLPGRRLIGAFIATLGLPQFDPVNQAICARMQQRFERGYDYAYLYPGLQKVVQAAGRVIRSETDQGSLVLADARYRDPRVRERLPRWWSVPPGLSAS